MRRGARDYLEGVAAGVRQKAEGVAVSVAVTIGSAGTKASSRWRRNTGSTRLSWRRTPARDLNVCVRAAWRARCCRPATCRRRWCARRRQRWLPVNFGPIRVAPRASAKPRAGSARARGRGCRGRQRRNAALMAMVQWPTHRGPSVGHGAGRRAVTIRPGARRRFTTEDEAARGSSANMQRCPRLLRSRHYRGDSLRRAAPYGGPRLSRRARGADRARQAHNNRLEHVWSADGREVVVKTYYQDDRHRLDREFTALVFLRTQGILDLPTPLLRDDEHQFAVYSFEPGRPPGVIAYRQCGHAHCRVRGKAPRDPPRYPRRRSLPHLYSRDVLVRGYGPRHARPTRAIHCPRRLGRRSIVVRYRLANRDRGAYSSGAPWCAGHSDPEHRLALFDGGPRAAQHPGNRG